MKNIKATLVIKAVGICNAEAMGGHFVMELARKIGMHSGSFMASGDGDATHVIGDLYRIDVNIKADGSGDVMEIIAKEQQAWMSDQRIMHSAVLVTDEAKEMAKCDYCGVEHEVDSLLLVDGKRYICFDCLMSEKDKGNIFECEACDCLVENLVENPVTHEATICPCCGANIG